MDGLLLHPRTRLLCQRLIAAKPHSILIAAPKGSGRETTARRLAGGILGLDSDSLAKYAYFKEINPDGDSISIDEIRDLQQFLKLKVPSNNTQNIRRLILIHEAQRMRTEAQNALLKTLEEPPLDTCLILTTDNPDQLLPTITSRVILLPILPVSQTEAREYFGEKGRKPGEIDKFYSLSQGQAGLLHALFNQEDHPLVSQVELAKLILAEKPQARLYRVDALSKDKAGTALLLNALSRISHAALSASAAKNSPTATKRWQHTQAAVVQSTARLKHNPNPKLLLDNLFLNI